LDLFQKIEVGTYYQQCTYFCNQHIIIVYIFKLFKLNVSLICKKINCLSYKINQYITIVEYFELNDNWPIIIVWYAEQVQKENGKRKQ
jgi:hypothetical protein